MVYLTVSFLGRSPIFLVSVNFTPSSLHPFFVSYSEPRRKRIMELGKEKRIFVRLVFTDMRKQINGLAAIVQQLRPEGPFDGSYFVFCGKTRRVLKILYWDATGFCLWQKRLENELFPWPRDGQELDEMTRHNIRLVLRGRSGEESPRRTIFRSGKRSTNYPRPTVPVPAAERTGPRSARSGAMSTIS